MKTIKLPPAQPKKEHLWCNGGQKVKVVCTSGRGQGKRVR